MVLNRSQYELEVAHARRAARALRIIAAITLAVGWLAVILAVIAVALEAVPWDQAQNLLWVLGVGSIVSALVMFASSWNLQLSASRMEIDIVSKLG